MNTRNKATCLIHGILIIALALSGCQKVPQAQRELNDDQVAFSTVHLAKKWNNQDSDYLKEFIIRLDDNSLTDAEFFNRIVEFSNVSGFVFGNADVDHNTWQERPEEEKKNFRKHVAWVYSLYLNSSFFLKEGSWDASQKFQDWYDTQFDWFSKPLPFDDAEEIRAHINTIKPN